MSTKPSHKLAILSSHVFTSKNYLKSNCYSLITEQSFHIHENRWIKQQNKNTKIIKTLNSNGQRHCCLETKLWSKNDDFTFFKVLQLSGRNIEFKELSPWYWGVVSSIIWSSCLFAGTTWCYSQPMQIEQLAVLMKGGSEFFE